MSKCILVIDDDRMSIEMSRRTLENKGYEVITAQDGLTALEALKNKVPDLILLDVMMPQLDGYGFIRQKTNNPATAKIPVIVLSAMEKTAPMFRRYGVKDYLIKPLDTKILLEKITTLIGS